MQFFSLRITALVFPSLFFFLLWWGGSTAEGVCMEQSQASGGGVERKNTESTVGWTALSLSLGSAWCLAKLTEPILSGCHCNINTHLEQMWLKAWNIEQTAATDPVPLHEHLCSINALLSQGREGSLYSLGSLADGSSSSTMAMHHIGLAVPSPTRCMLWLLTPRSSSISLQIYVD